MKKMFSIMLFISMLPLSVFASGMNDDPLLTMVKIDKLEVQDADRGEDKPLVLDASAWIGYDLDKLYLKTEVDRVGSENEDAEAMFLYSHAVYPFWDVQVGWRHDLDPQPERDWLVIGMQGLAPYMFEINSYLFIGENSRLAARLVAEYEYMFTQRWVLMPEIEINAYSKDDRKRGIGSGLSDMTAGLRLAYHVRREFAPYIGVNANTLFADTADMVKAAGGERSDTQLVLGVRVWF